MNRSAFTLLEILVVLIIFLTMGALFVPFSISQFNGTRVDVTANAIVSNLATLQIKAFASLNDTSYGIQFNNTSFTTLVGQSTDNISSFEQISFENNTSLKNLTLSGPSNIIFFNKGSMKPDQYGEIIIGDDINQYKIIINSEGMIDHYKL